MARGDGGGRDGRGEPEWRPVIDVDMMTAVVLEQLGAHHERPRTLEPARRAPRPLDDRTGERIKQVSGGRAMTCGCGSRPASAGGPRT
ncbi:hypothetical protein ACWEJ6_50535 [Nonomuraea sp. NPDC004702]